MNKRINKYMSMAAVFAVCSAMISCSSSNKKVGNVTSDGGESSVSVPQNVLTEDKGEEGSYKAAKKSLPSEMTYISSIKEVAGGEIYLLGNDKDINKLIYRADKDLSDFTAVELREYKNSDVLYIAPADGLLYVLVVSVTYDGLPEPDYDDPDIDWSAYEEAAVYNAVIDTYGEDGKLVSTVEVTGLEEDALTSTSFIQGFELTLGGSFIMCAGNKIIKLNKDGTAADIAELPEYYIDSCGLDSSGNFVCVSGGSKIYTFDTEKMEILSSDELGQSIWIDSIAPGKGEYRLIMSLNDGFYGLKDNTKKLYKLVDSVNTGLKANGTYQIIALDNGEFAAAGNVFTSAGESLIPIFYHIAERTEEEIKNTQVIKLGNLGGINTDFIDEFNNSNDSGCRIEVMQGYGTGKEDVGEAFNMSLITGEAPDLVCASDYTLLQNLAGKGALADMYPFLDSDEELSRDSFLPNFLKANESDGKLVALPRSFCINTIVAKSEFIGGAGENWTMDEMLSAVDSMPDNMYLYNSAMDAEQVLQDLVFHTTSCYIDYNKRTCSFDSPEFVSMLELAKNTRYLDVDYDGAYDWRDNAYKLDEALIYPAMLHDDEDYKWLKEDVFGGSDITFVGYPSSDGTGGSFFFANTFAVMESSENKEGAWEFIRYFFSDEFFLSDEYQMSQVLGFPAVRKYQSFYDKQIEEYVGTVRITGSYDYDIFNIIKDEAGYYFNGEHTAQQAADMIQNRVSILVSEQSW